MKYPLIHMFEELGQDNWRKEISLETLPTTLGYVLFQVLRKLQTPRDFT